MRKKFITSREAVADMNGNEGAALMVPLTGSLYVRGKLNQGDSLIVGESCVYLLVHFKFTINYVI